MLSLDIESTESKFTDFFLSKVLSFFLLIPGGVGEERID